MAGSYFNRSKWQVRRNRTVVNCFIKKKPPLFTSEVTSRTVVCFWPYTTRSKAKDIRETAFFIISASMKANYGLCIHRSDTNKTRGQKLLQDDRWIKVFYMKYWCSCIILLHSMYIYHKVWRLFKLSNSVNQNIWNKCIHLEHTCCASSKCGSLLAVDQPKMLSCLCRNEVGWSLESYKHRMVWVGRGYKGHLVPTPLPQGRENFH